MNASFWSFCGMGPYLVAVPYTTDSSKTGPFIWAQQGLSNVFQQPANAPGGRVGAIVGQFLMVGDVLQQETQIIGVGNGVQTLFAGSLSALPMLAAGGVYDQNGKFAGSFVNGNIVGSGTLATPSSVRLRDGRHQLAALRGAPNADSIYVNYTLAAPYRVQWSAIGDPTNWPIPLTANAIAFQSGYQDLQVDLGPVKFIAGYPLYGVIFQEFGISRANYVGGNVVFAFATFSRNRGMVAKGAGVVVGGLVYFLAQDGFFVTDGNSVNPIGTDAENDVGIDQWFWSNVNVSALETIRAAYDSTTRCVYFAVPTGTNPLPDTLLTYNPIALRWTKCAIPTELLWVDTNAGATPGTVLRVGLFDQNHQYSSLTGPTINGYLETCDVMDADGDLRFTMGARPNVACMDTPQAVVGVRNALQDAVAYTASAPPDPFARIVPALVEGLYTRVRVSSTAASAFTGATLYQQEGGPV